MKNWRANLNTVLNSLNNKHIGELEISLMRITIPNLHIYKINFYPETTEYCEISLGHSLFSGLLLRSQDWICICI